MEKILYYIRSSDKKARYLFIVLFLCVIVFSTIFLIKENRIRQISNSITIEAGQKLRLEANDFFEGKEEKIKKIVFYTDDVDVNIVGTYEIEAKFGKQTFAITINVEDTTSPMISFSKKYLFTANLENIDKIMSIVEHIYEVSEFTMSLTRFEKIANLSVMDEVSLKSFTDNMLDVYKESEVEPVVSQEVPQEEGIYRTILEVVDVYGNTFYEPIIVILDKTGAYIEDVPDKTIEVEKEKLENEPNINLEDYNIVDNVDGKIAPESIQYELELKDEEKKDWIVYVCYIDRAGNESHAEFLVKVREKKNVSNIQNIYESQINNNETRNDKDNHLEEIINTTDIETEESEIDIKVPNNSKNKNENEWVVTDNEHDISPWEQKVIDAGYGNVVDFGDGSYGVLTHNDGYVGNKRGGEILREYLARLNLEPQNVSGGVIDEDEDLRWYIADNIREVNSLANEW